MKKISVLAVFAALLILTTIHANANYDITVSFPKSDIKVETIPEYNGEDYIVLHNNLPGFYIWQLTTDTFVSFSPLDSMGRTGTGFACLGRETLPSEPRGSIGNIQPSGWQTVRYDDLIPDKYLYNRCHVIGFMLSGDNATPENLFTGTRYLNMTLMKQIESSVSEYIQGTGNHVLYRVTPFYKDDDLVAFGVQMEGYSVEDHGGTICFNVFLYNIQPGIQIDYKTGLSRKDPDYSEASSELFLLPVELDNNNTPASKDLNPENQVTYVLNTNTKKFHYPYCSSVSDMKPTNREDFYGTREEAISAGYKACKRCNP